MGRGKAQEAEKKARRSPLTRIIRPLPPIKLNLPRSRAPKSRARGGDSQQNKLCLGESGGLQSRHRSGNGQHRYQNGA